MGDKLTDYYFIKYYVSANKGSYSFISGIQIAQLSGIESHSLLSSDLPFAIIVGPVSRGFATYVEAYPQSGYYSFSVSISISKNDGPYLLKNSNTVQNSNIAQPARAYYIIDF